jgi:hypothetical protein
LAAILMLAFGFGRSDFAALWRRLVALVIAVGTAVKTNSQRAATKTILQDMTAIYASYQQETGAAPSNVSTLVVNVMAMPQFKKAMNALPPSTLQASNVNDGFGTALTLVPASATPYSSGTAYSAGTVVFNAGIIYLCTAQTTPGDAPPDTAHWHAFTSAQLAKVPFFVSAGPDGQFGTTDDIYSFDP